MGKYFAILPSGGLINADEYCRAMSATPITPGFSYNSGTNSDFLTVADLRELIGNHFASDRQL
jgi:hypothetical protein